MRAINHYRLDRDDPSIVASGHDGFDLGLARQLTHTVELNLSLDNLTNRDYYETQNYFESRVTPDALGHRPHSWHPGLPCDRRGGNYPPLWSQVNQPPGPLNRTSRQTLTQRG